MPLHYDYQMCDVEDMSDTVIEAVIFGTMGLGINKITEDNIDDWLDRAKIRAALQGPAVFNHEKPHVCLLTDRETMERFIGLWTNATSMSISKWFKQLHTGVVSDRNWLRTQRERREKLEHA